MSAHGLELARAKMRAAGESDAAIEVFSRYYAEVEAGTTGFVDEASIEPLVDVPELADVEVDPDAARAALQQTVIIKLNGGLGTSMGLDRAKTLLTVRDGKSFLDLQAEQILHARRAHDARLPLLLMNSFRTRHDSL